MIEKYDKKKWQQDISEMLRNDKKKIIESTNKIEELAQRIDASRLFVSIVANMAFRPAELQKESIVGALSAKIELLAYHLYPFWGSSDNKDITPWDTNECIEALDDLFYGRERLQMFSKILCGSMSPVDSLIGSVKTEAYIVRGAAYPEQTMEKIKFTQGKYDTWFEKRIGIGPLKAIDTLWAIIRIAEDNFNKFIPVVREYANQFSSQWRAAKKKQLKERTSNEIKLLQFIKNKNNAWLFGRVKKLNEISPDFLPVSIDDLRKKVPLINSEWNSFLNLIGLEPEIRKKMADLIEMRKTPLFILPDGKVFITNISNALDVLWNCFELVAKNDHKFHSGRYQRSKKEWLEGKVSYILSNIFSEINVYKNLTYLNPDKDSRDIAELDAAVEWGPFLVLVEAKAKQFRLESQLGDVGRLFTDIKKNIEDAFEQAKRAVRYISKAESAEFLEHSSGRKLIINKNRIRRIYLLTISLHHLAGLATRLSTFQDLGLFKDGEYPISIGIGDLEIVKQFCDGPDVFLHYIEKRLELQKRDEEFFADELDLWGAYLDTRLQESRLWGRDGKKFDGVWLSGFSERFDDWMMYRRGDLKQEPVIKLQLPDEILSVLKELRRHDDNARWVAFALLDMSDNILGAIAQALRELKTAQLTPGMFRRLVYQYGDTVLSIVASLDQPSDLLYKRTATWAILEKYRRKVHRSIGFGVMVLDTSKPFEHAVWGEGPWEYETVAKGFSPLLSIFQVKTGVMGP